MQIIKEFPKYRVSEDGNVYSFKSNQPILLKQQMHYKGYKVVTLSDGYRKKTYKVHRLVAQAFIDNPFNKEQVNHIDGDKKNNHYLNLEWATQSENQIHAHKSGLMNNKIKLSIERSSKKVMSIIDGTIYNSLKEACKVNDLKYKTEFAKMKYYNTSNFKQL